MSGAAFCWGGNSFGQLGIGIRDSVEILTPVAGGLSFIALSTSGVHTCGLTAQGAAYCWGGNQFRQLGTGSDAWAWAAVPVAGHYTFRQVVAGWRRTYGYCWGDNNADGGGTGTTGNTLPLPTPIAGNYSFTQLTSGYEYTCGVTSGGPLLCWGGNSSAMLGVGNASNTPTALPIPVVLFGVSFSAVTGSMMHTCAIASTRVTYCWGLNQYGEVGDSTTQIRSAPVRVRAR